MVIKGRCDDSLSSRRRGPCLFGVPACATWWVTASSVRGARPGRLGWRCFLFQRRSASLYCGAGAERAAVRFAQLFAIWTVGWWFIRSVLTLLHDHSAAFRIVHLLLAVVSCALAVGAWRAIQAGADSSEGTRGVYAPSHGSTGHRH